MTVLAMMALLFSKLSNGNSWAARVPSADREGPAWHAYLSQWYNQLLEMPSWTSSILRTELVVTVSSIDNVRWRISANAASYFT